MTKHIGNYTVTHENALSFPAITEFYGRLTIAAGAMLVAPSLTLVRGWLTVEGILTASQLGEVSGWVTLKPRSAIYASALTKITNDLIMAYDVKTNLVGVETVGSLILQCDAEWLAPYLTEVKMNLSLGTGAVLTCGVQKVGGSITMKERSVLGASELSHIGGYADIDESATLVAPRFLS